MEIDSPSDPAQLDPTATKMPVPESVWTKRRQLLPRLQSRAQNILTLILGGLDVDENGDPILPQSTTKWIKRIVSEAGENGLEDHTDLFKRSCLCPSGADRSYDGNVYQPQVHSYPRIRGLQRILR